MGLKVLFKLTLLQVRLQAEYLLCNLLVLPLYAFELCLALIKVQTLCLELNCRHGMTLAECGPVINFV